MSWFNIEDGYGYITPDDNSPDVLVHWTAIRAKGRRVLYDGERVSFELGPQTMVLQATSVTPL